MGTINVSSSRTVLLDGDTLTGWLTSFDYEPKLGGPDNGGWMEQITHPAMVDALMHHGIWCVHLNFSQVLPVRELELTARDEGLWIKTQLRQPLPLLTYMRPEWNFSFKVHADRWTPHDNPIHRVIDGLTLCAVSVTTEAGRNT